MAEALRCGECVTLRVSEGSDEAVPDSFDSVGTELFVGAVRDSVSDGKLVSVRVGGGVNVRVSEKSSLSDPLPDGLDDRDMDPLRGILLDNVLDLDSCCDAVCVLVTDTVLDNVCSYVIGGDAEIDTVCVLLIVHVCRNDTVTLAEVLTVWDLRLLVEILKSKDSDVLTV